MPQTCPRKLLVSFLPEFWFSSVAMLGRKRARVFSRVATLSEKSRDAPPPSSLLPPSWRGAIRLFRRILTSHSQGPMVQVPSWSVPVSVFLLVVLCLITSALCRRPPVLRKFFPRAFQSLSSLAPHVAFSSLEVRSRLLHLLSVFSANVPHTLAASGISRLMLRRPSSSIFVGHSASFTAARARTMKKVDPKIVRQRSLIDVSWPPRAGSEPVQIVKMTMVHITHGIVSMPSSSNKGSKICSSGTLRDCRDASTWCSFSDKCRFNR